MDCYRQMRMVSVVIAVLWAASLRAELSVLWHWNTSSQMPNHVEVGQCPLVVPLGPGDSQLAVVFVSFWKNVDELSWNDNGILRAIDAATGTEIWTVPTPIPYTQPAGEIAAGDIDLDGYIEIVAPGATSVGHGTYAFEHDGTVKWYSPYPSNAPVYRTIVIADLDADGSPEIICGRLVLTAGGSLLWQRTGSSQTWAATVADLDCDGFKEIIDGNTVFAYDSSIKWSAEAAANGFSAVGDVTGDSEPEVVFVSLNNVYLYDRMGSLIWGPVVLPDAISGGGAPCLADVDGNHALEIVISDRNWLFVLDGEGSIKWQQPISDTSSGRNGCSAFDFDGDGRWEITAQDQNVLRVYDGTTGAVLHEIENGSITMTEYPVISDVDGDGSVEIVACANTYIGSVAGVRALKPVEGTWSAGRKIWNQYSYHVTDVNDDGRIPAAESPWWMQTNTFRAQLPFTPTPVSTPTPAETPTPPPLPVASGTSGLALVLLAGLVIALASRGRGLDNGA